MLLIVDLCGLSHRFPISFRVLTNQEHLKIIWQEAHIAKTEIEKKRKE